VFVLIAEIEPERLWQRILRNTAAASSTAPCAEPTMIARCSAGVGLRVLLGVSSVGCGGRRGFEQGLPHVEVEQALDERVPG
jgi:hypothetical protein